MGRRLDAALAILNGLIGDHLAARGNGLAIEMELYRRGRPLALTREALARAYPAAGGRVVVLVHGLMCTEAIWELPDGSDYGALLARDLGYTPLYVRYNSGRAISDNGAALARLLASLAAAYPAPLEELLLVGHSMGGLVVRGACHLASREGLAWLPRVRRAIYVGTPHLGAPLERLGRAAAEALRAIGDPYTRLAADLGDLRSAGVRDLGDAAVCPEERAPGGSRRPAQLPPPIRHYLIAGALSRHPRLAARLGDAMVPLASATNGACVCAATMALPPPHVRILHGVAHVSLARRPEVYEHIRAWCEEAA
jgi:pimeloyl-ACP methyl ester carboxylesterase